MRYLAIFLMIACSASAQSASSYLSDEGHQYAYSENENGAILTSLFPVGRFIGTGVTMKSVIEIEVLYLGASCDAFSEVLGEGTWGWANAGFTVTFHSREIAFPRGEIRVPGGQGCTI